jgi:hypothetical protein
VNGWEKRYQACNDPEAWPFAQVAQAVAAWDPDLIVHVGDYLYRESPCPAGMTGCEGNPYGDNWATWDADFFTPAASVLGAAPWFFMRGNHETCSRNPVGWFTFFDPRRFQPSCQRFTEPYIAALNGVSFAVIDSAEAADTSDTPEETAEYAHQFAQLTAITPSGSWLVTHRPVWGIVEGKEFDEMSDRPPQLVSGNAGTALDDIPTASPAAGELGDSAVIEAETLSAFGFMTLELDDEGWIVTQRDRRGSTLLECVLVVDQLSCEVPEGD